MWSHGVTSFVLTRKGFVGSIAHVPDIRPAERDARKCRRSSAGGLVSLKRPKKNKRMQRHCNLMSNLVFWCHITVSSKMSMCPNFPVQSCASRNDSRTDLQNMEGSPAIDLEEPSPEAATPTNRAISVITDFDMSMCKVCTEAVHCVALWTRTLSQVWACVKNVLCTGTRGVVTGTRTYFVVQSSTGVVLVVQSSTGIVLCSTEEYWSRCLY